MRDVLWWLCTTISSPASSPTSCQEPGRREQEAARTNLASGKRKQPGSYLRQADTLLREAAMNAGQNLTF